MDRHEFIEKVKDTLTSYVNNEITGVALVRTINHLMADEKPSNLEEPEDEILDTMHDDLAFYVQDPVKRQQHSAFYGEGELYRKAQLYLSRLVVLEC
jgi:hypothetical protein